MKYLFNFGGVYIPKLILLCGAASSRDELAFLLRGTAFQKPIPEFAPSFDGQLIPYRDELVLDYEGIAKLCLH